MEKKQLSEMSTAEGMEFVAKVYPAVVKMAKNKDVQQLYREAAKERKPLSEFLFEAIIELMKEQKGAIYEALSIQEGKSPEEIEAQPFTETMQQVQFLFDKSFVGFFTYALSMKRTK